LPLAVENRIAAAGFFLPRPAVGGALLSLLFAFLTAESHWPIRSQSGLALQTLFGLGFSALLGQTMSG